MKKPGLKVQMIWGTGKPPWKKIMDRDLSRTITNINRMAPEKMLISPHDSCDHALRRFETDLDAGVSVLEAGKTYEF